MKRPEQRSLCGPVEIAGTEFQNPVILASGTFGFGLEFPRVVARLGGIVTKGITLKPCLGNPPPRIWETACGVINSVGLENPGVDAFTTHILPKLSFGQAKILVNIAGSRPSEYAEIVRRADHPRVAGFELNVSCPNVKQGGLLLGQRPKMVARIVREVRPVTKKLLVTKLTAAFVDPVDTAQAALDAGTDAITLINTMPALAFDSETGRPGLGGITGGLSGPALKPFALYCVWRVAQRVRVPIIACGGIFTGLDAADFLAAGACLVQLGTANLVNPEAGLNVLRELRQLEKQRVRRATTI